MDQSAVTPGIPAEYEPIITLVIAWAAAWLVQPLTALAKKWGCTSGVTTVMVSAVLSLLVTVGFSLAAAEATGEVSWLSVVTAAVLAWARANGSYVNDVFAGQKANKTAKPPDDGPQVRRLD